MIAWARANWRRVVIDSWDPFFAAVAGVVLAILGAVGGVSPAGLTQWTLALLSLLAFSLIRERLMREDVAKSIEQRLARTAAEVRDADPYRVVENTVEWKIEATDGSHALYCSDSLLQFAHDRCLAIATWSQAEGSTEDESFKGGPARSAMSELEVVGRVRGKRGMHRVLLLGRIYDRDDTMYFVHTRTLKDTFTAANEGVSAVANSPCDQQRLTVIWPKDRPPATLCIRRGGRPQKVPLTQVKLTDEGRPTFSCEQNHLEKDETVELEWDW